MQLSIPDAALLLRCPALVLACALCTTACGGLIELDSEPIAGAGAAAGVGGTATGGGGGFGTGSGGTATGGGGGFGTGGSGEPVCMPGQRLVLVGEPAEPVCQPCWDGTFSTVYQAATCAPWTVCTWEELEVVSPSSSNDRLCAYGSPTRQFGTPESDEALDVAVDDQGFVFVSGLTFGSLDAPNPGDADAFVRQYTPAGDLVWGRHIASSTSYESGVRLVLGYGSLPYVLTHRYPGSPETEIYAVTPYADNLVDSFVEWGEDFALGTDASLLLARSVSHDSVHSLTELRRIPADGSMPFVTELGAGNFAVPSDLELLADGGFVVAGTTDGPLFHASTGLQEVFVARFAKNGDLTWGVQFGTDGWAYSRALAVDAFGDIYVVGSLATVAAGASAGMVARVSASGTLEWMNALRLLDSTTELVDVAVSDANEVIVAGNTYATYGGAYYETADVVVFRLLPEGSPGAVHSFGTGADDWARAIAIAPDGGVFVVGGTTGSLVDGNPASVDAFIRRLPSEAF